MTEAHRSKEPDARTQAFEALRPRLFGIAYRMLETRADAEDALQEAWFRCQRAQGQHHRGGGPVNEFLVTALTRICIDELQSARKKRAGYPGTWLPEPMLTTDAGPDEGGVLEAGRHAALTVGELLVMDRLDPLDRAVYVLRAAFEYSFDEIARAVGKRRDVCVQMADRAAKRIQAERPRVESDAAVHTRLLMRMPTVAAQGDAAAMEALLTEDVTLLSDGGGGGAALTAPVVGRYAVARYLLAWVADEAEGTTRELVQLNGLPGMVVRVGDAVVATVSLDVREGGTCRVYLVRNPGKLKGV